MISNYCRPRPPSINSKDLMGNKHHYFLQTFSGSWEDGEQPRRAHLIEFSSAVNSEAALKFNPLSFRAKAQQHKTLGHVLLCPTKAPLASTSICSAHQLTPPSLNCSDWLPSHTRLTLEFNFNRNPLLFLPQWYKHRSRLFANTLILPN